MCPLYHPALLSEYLTFGDMKKLCKVLRVLHSELKKRKDSGDGSVLRERCEKE
ncbi:MAG: hypothetical protein P4M11_02995 [Candidatus Pacebacteria bacterium]|nr:hypothetical protein [Candidatus Paceibacterota bacterium]